MTAPYEPGDPIRAAEAAAEDWSRDYVGRRRANEDGTPMRLDEQTMADLIAARVALWLGDREGHDTAEQAALLNLYRQGHTWASAHAAIKASERDVDREAHMQLDLLRLDQVNTLADMWTVCPDVPLHRRWDQPSSELSWWRRSRGLCGYCGLPKPRGTR